MTTTEAIQHLTAKIEKAEAIRRGTTFRHNGTDRFREEYIRDLKEVRGELERLESNFKQQ